MFHKEIIINKFKEISRLFLSFPGYGPSLNAYRYLKAEGRSPTLLFVFWSNGPRAFSLAFFLGYRPPLHSWHHHSKLETPSPKRTPGGVRERTDGFVVMACQQQREKSRVVKVDSEESWDLFIAQANNQGRPVFVHFSASWCVPSVAMNSYFEELAKIYQDVVFLLVDVDELKVVASKMEVKAMPTFVLMRDGAVITKIIGANPEEMKKRIDAFVHLLGSTSTME